MFRKMRNLEKETKCFEKCCNKNRNWKRRFCLICILSTRSIEINGYLMTVISKIRNSIVFLWLVKL